MIDDTDLLTREIVTDIVEFLLEQKVFGDALRDLDAYAFNGLVQMLEYITERNLRRNEQES